MGPRGFVWSFVGLCSSVQWSLVNGRQPAVGCDVLSVNMLPRTSFAGRREGTGGRAETCTRSALPSTIGWVRAVKEWMEMMGL